MAETFKIREDGIRFELRGEAFNLLNRITFGQLSRCTRLQNANFGLLADVVEFTAAHYRSRQVFLVS